MRGAGPPRCAGTQARGQPCLHVWVLWWKGADLIGWWVCNAMLQQIINDMYVDPELLEELSKEQVHARGCA